MNEVCNKYKFGLKGEGKTEAPMNISEGKCGWGDLGNKKGKRMKKKKIRGENRGLLSCCHFNLGDENESAK